LYIIGLASAIVSNNPDPNGLLIAANLGIVALGVVVLSTVTTTFLDAYSAGITTLNIFPRLSEKHTSLVMGIIGTIVAVILPIEQYQNFLYAIGSIFAPLFAVLLTDYFIIKKQRELDDRLLLNIGAALVWIIGVIIYYRFIKLDFILGATVPVMVITSIIYILSWKVVQNWRLMKR
jgi:purine-cytosine permease-like protein